MNAKTSEISGLNRRKCITVLHKNLADLAIAVLPHLDQSVLDKPRGGIYFMEFVPEETSFRTASGFPQLFYATQRYSLISPLDANYLVHKLLTLAVHTQKNYRGRLAKHLEVGPIGEFIGCARDPEALQLIETRGNWFPDILIEQFSWPCVIGDYLVAKEFSALRLDFEAISANANVPIRALAGGTDLVRNGPWLGLTTPEIDASLDLLGGKDAGSAGTPNRAYGEKIVIPIFSSGYQGAIIGFFCNLTDNQRWHIRAILDQVGHCLGEISASERRAKIRTLLKHRSLNARIIADAVLQIASPVEHVAVSYRGEHYAYVVAREENYLAGYEQRTDNDAALLTLAPDALELDLAGMPAAICVTPVAECPGFDPILHTLRIKTALFELVEEASTCAAETRMSQAQNGILPIEYEEIDRIIATLQHQMSVQQHGRRVTAKRLSFFEAVKGAYGCQEVRLSNSDMLRRMSAKLAEPRITGYQVTGEALKKFESDINDLCPNKFCFYNLNDRIVRVQWLSVQ